MCQASVFVCVSLSHLGPVIFLFSFFCTFKKHFLSNGAIRHGEKIVAPVYVCVCVSLQMYT